MLPTLLDTKILRFKLKKKKNNYRWTNLDKYIPKLDSERKVIDDQHYKEKRYFVVKSELCTVSLEDRKILRWVIRFMYKRQSYVKVFSSDDIHGKFVFDRSHAKRYINSFRYMSDV